MNRFDSELADYNTKVAAGETINPSQRNLLYNNEGLPASPFRTDI